jgi:hypothetical protein
MACFRKPKLGFCHVYIPMAAGKHPAQPKEQHEIYVCVDSPVSILIPTNEPEKIRQLGLLGLSTELPAL